MGSGLASLVLLVAHLATFIVVLRFLLHLSAADYFNPITQALVKITNPLLLPLHRVLRPRGRIDLASLLLAWAIQVLGIWLALQAYGTSAGLGGLLVGGVAGLVKTVLDIYFFALILSIILSWVAPYARHPGALLIFQLTEPLMAPVRRVIPSLGGLDFSPIVVFLAINLLSSVLGGVLAQLAGMPVAGLLSL